MTEKISKQELADLIKKGEAISNELEKRRCEKDFAYFIKCAWSIIEPGTELQYNWHINTICGYLEAFHNDELPNKRLIINIPPGTLKSIIVSCMYPAWCWVNKPDLRFLSIANESGLSTRDSLRMKQVVTSDWFQNHWPLAMQADQNEKTLFVNAKRGFRLSQGVLACATGKRGDCFPGYVKVSTEHGMKRIDSVSVGENVYSMNIETGLIELKPINKVYHNKNNDILELAFSNGEIIHCTPDHKIWTIEDGYIEAINLSCSGFSHLSPDIISMIDADSKQLGKLFCREIGVHDKEFIGWSEFIFGKHSMSSSEAGNDGNMTAKMFCKFFNSFGRIKNNILVGLSNFYDWLTQSCITPVTINCAFGNSELIREELSFIGHIKNFIKIVVGKFSLKDPRINLSFFDSVICPELTKFYIPNGSWIYSIFISDNRCISSIKTNSLSNIWSKFRSWPIDTNRKCSMTFGIGNVLTSRSPCKIPVKVIKWVPVKMPDLKIWIRFFSMKGGANGNVDMYANRLSLIMPTRFKIPTSIFALLKDFCWPDILPTIIIAINNKPFFASNESCVADRVHTVIARNGSPLNVISVRRIGHINDTYCLNIKDNHNMFTGKSEGVLVSNCVIMDDLIDSKHAFSDVICQTVNDTFDQTLSTRINDPVKSGFILIMQRLRHDDITGHLLKKTKAKWTHLSIPMRYEGDNTYDAGKDIGRPELNDPRTKKGELLFPQRFTEEAVQSLEEDLGEHGVSGQLQQRPSPLGGGIIKKHWWRVWPEDQPIPACTHIFHSWDTAFSEADSKRAAYSAMTRWGIFWHEQRERYCIMALGMWFARVGFDELRKQVKEFDNLYNPDINLVEKKATGITLVQELKRASPGKVRAYTPGRGEDKVSRAHSVSPMVESGQCYIPAKEWALGNGTDKLGLTDYLAMFPTGGPPGPDLTDTVTQALIYMRSGLWAGYHDDDKDDPYEEKKRSDEEIEDADNDQVRSFYG